MQPCSIRFSQLYSADLSAAHLLLVAYRIDHSGFPIVAVQSNIAVHGGRLIKRKIVRHGLAGGRSGLSLPAPTLALLRQR